MGTEPEVRALEVVGDIGSRPTYAEPVSRYRRSSNGIQSVLHLLMEEQRKITRELVKDLRAGFTDSQLAQRYRLSPEALKLTIAKLVEHRLIGEDELICRGARIRQEFHAFVQRQAPRYCPTMAVAVLEDQDPANRGTLLDISERGVGVLGIESAAGEVKTLTVLGDELGEFDVFTFDAACRWTKTKNGLVVAGFEITRISEEILLELVEWMRVCTICADEP
jgi:hypothetical protein